MKNIVLYLDHDGVVNIYQSQCFRDLEKTFVRSLDEPDKDYKVRWSPTLIRELNNFDIEIVWLSSWKKSGPVVLDPLYGLNSNGFLDWEYRKGDYFDAGKYRALQEDQARNPRPFIWADDVATRNFKSSVWRKNLGREDFLILQTSERFGLNIRHLDKMDEFIKKVDSGS